MSQIVECVPNFSEGRDPAKVKTIVDAALSAGVTLLDVETDADHHRCVLSFVGAPDNCIEACFRVAKESARLIDLTKHRGEHPRMGAVDVIPFIPVSGVTIADCVVLAEKLGERIGQELSIPVFLYDHAARTPERRDLANVRKGQFEGLRDLIGKDPLKKPDFGPNKIHPTAGAIAVGARQQIVNFNLNLDTNDMNAGKDIAKRLRASGGGLPAVRAKEIELSSRGQVQISTVLTNYQQTSLKQVYDETARLAKEHKAKITSTEFVGLLPRQALVDFSLHTLNPENFKSEVQILENRLQAVGALNPSSDWKMAGRHIGEALANTDATPGGGSAAGIAAAMGCGLGQMALGITLKSKKIDEKVRKSLSEYHQQLGLNREEFNQLTAKDAEAFDHFMSMMSLPKTDATRSEKMQLALKRAADVPLETTQKSVQAYLMVQAALPMAGAAVASDIQCALHLLKAAAFCAAENVRINLSSIKDTATLKELESGLQKALEPLNERSTV